jgi:CRISPR system Cascade subunit CasE
MDSVFISTVRISDERAIAPVVFRRAAVGQVLSPEHHVVRSLFGRSDTQRKWLYRRLTDRTVRVLSIAAPTSSPYATVITTREQKYDWLDRGARLVFKLQANAVKRIVVDERPKKVDVVMHALHPLPCEERSERREEITRRAPRQVGREPGMRCVFEGSIRRGGDCAAQLINATTGAHRWVDRWIASLRMCSRFRAR